MVGAQTANERSHGLPLAGEVTRWLFTGQGILTYSASVAAASLKVLEESATPDVQCSIAPGSFKDGQIGAPGRPALRAIPGVDDFPGITAVTWQMWPLSRSYVEARSPNPAEAPAINPRYLSDPTDRRAIVNRVRKNAGMQSFQGADFVGEPGIQEY